MRRKLSFVIAAAVLVALAATNPYLAQAAAMITGGDIQNGTVTSADLKDGTVQGVDIAADTVRGSDVRNGTLTAPDFAAGTLGASAYGYVNALGASPSLVTAASKNVLGVTRPIPGRYCVELAAGVNRNVSVVAMVDWNNTTPPEAAASVQWMQQCGTHGIMFITERITVSGDTVADATAEDVSFMFIVP